MPSRLNLGCGPDPMEGWDNLDVDPSRVSDLVVVAAHGSEHIGP
jgi:hypothetical protein